jgi:transcriptional regulator with XRE-family HTH domain
VILMRENPVKRVRDELGLSRHDIAVMAGCGIVYVYQLERGSLTRVPESICKVLAGLGVDAVALGREYAAWRAELGEKTFVETRAAQGFGAR